MSIQLPGRRTALAFAAAVALVGGPATAFAQADDNAAVANAIVKALTEKASRAGAQNKVDTQLLHASKAARGEGSGDTALLYGSAYDAIKPAANGNVRVTIVGDATDPALASAIAAAGGKVVYTAANQKRVLVSVPVAGVEALAGVASVRKIGLASPARGNLGSLMSQGYISHKANLVVQSGYNGSGVRVGVISDSVDYLSALIGTGDLPADSVVITDGVGVVQDGIPGSSEGTAMMEIVADLAPGAKLFFATAFNGEESFADNIRRLRDVYKCDIIVDDISYFDEPVFQDGIVAQAVNDVTAKGALYFSSAANSGNLTSGTSGTWEGDFNPGTTITVGSQSYTLHRFSTGLDYNVLTGSTSWVGLHWADAWDASANDYDLFLLNSAGTATLCSSTYTQDGTVGTASLEYCYNGSGWPANSRIVIAKKAGAAPRALHIDTQRGTLSVRTSGATIGHNAGRNTVSTAAVYWNSARTGTRPFVGGAANPTEPFSSDGPRKIFFNPDGTPITPGNYLFGTGGGETLVKPDIAAADGVTTRTPGFNPFFGTSAAAPHAAAIAALIKSARPDYTNAQILAAMKATALDIRAAGLDRDAGYGLVMAQEAVKYALTH